MEMGLGFRIGKALSHGTGMAGQTAFRQAAFALRGAQMRGAGLHIIGSAGKRPHWASAEAGFCRASFAWMLRFLRWNIEGHWKHKRRAIGMPEAEGGVNVEAQR